MTFSPFDFDVCTSPEEQEAAARRVREGRASALFIPGDAGRPRPETPASDQNTSGSGG